MSAQSDDLARTMMQNGHRLTRARQVIITKLVETGGHLSADDLAEQIRASDPNIGRMTVYRTLDLLTKLGLTRPIFQGTGAAHYILMTEGSHHHLICSRCQQVIEFDQCSATDAMQQLAEQYGFAVHSHLLDVHGLCQPCQAAGQ